MQCKYPNPIHTRTRSFFQYPNPIRPEVEYTYPLDPVGDHLVTTWWPLVYHNYRHWMYPRCYMHLWFQYFIYVHSSTLMQLDAGMASWPRLTTVQLVTMGVQEGGVPIKLPTPSPSGALQLKQWGRKVRSSQPAYTCHWEGVHIQFLRKLWREHCLSQTLSWSLGFGLWALWAVGTTQFHLWSWANHLCWCVIILPCCGLRTKLGSLNNLSQNPKFCQKC